MNAVTEVLREARSKRQLGLLGFCLSAAAIIHNVIWIRFPVGTTDVNLVAPIAYGTALLFYATAVVTTCVGRRVLTARRASRGSGFHVVKNEEDCEQLQRRYDREQLLTINDVRVPHVLIAKGPWRQEQVRLATTAWRPSASKYRIQADQPISPKELEGIAITHRDKITRTGREWYDGRCLRLAGIEVIGSDIHFQLSNSWALEHLATNAAMEVVVENGHTVRDLCEPGPALKRLEKSCCANILGMSCLLISSDGFLILAKRSTSVDFAGKLGASVSGACDWDKNSRPDLFELMLKEIKEEVGLTRADVDEILLLAVCRDIRFGGKPESFFVARSKITADEIDEKWRDASCSRETQALQRHRIGSWSDFRVCLKRLAQSSEQCAESLLGNLASVLACMNDSALNGLWQGGSANGKT